MVLTQVRTPEEGLTICTSTTHYQSAQRHTQENCDLQDGNRLEDLIFGIIKRL